MQPVDALTLHHAAGEWDLKLADGKINKIQQASHYDVLFHLWVGGEAGRRKFYVNIRPEYAFCALLEDTSFLTFPEKATNFCMVLRKHLVSARIRQITTLPDERVLNVNLDNYNELGQRVHLVLSIELMGKHSNIILYDADLNVIIGCAHGVSEAMSSKREISVGYPYAPPPKPNKSPLRLAPLNQVVQHIQAAKTTGEDPAEALSRQFSGVGKATLRDVFACYPENDEAAVQALDRLFRGEALYPAVHRDGERYSLLGAHQDDPEWQPMGSLNRMIATFAMAYVLGDRLSSTRQQLIQCLNAQERKIRKRREEVEKTDATAIEALKQAGDLLTLACSRQMETPGSCMELEDVETGQPVVLELDPTLTLAENAQLYYRRYKKARTRQILADDMAQQLETTLAFIENLREAVGRAARLDELMALREDLEAQGWIKPLETGKKGAKKQASSPLSLTSSDGLTMLVGKNSLQNDQLVGKLSRPEDIWLHAHLIPGSHVLIKADKQTVPDQTLLEAAMLAAHYSQAQNSVNVPVVYTEARYVRKIPNSYPGHVNYTHEKAVNVTPDEAMLEKLLGSTRSQS